MKSAETEDLCKKLRKQKVSQPRLFVVKNKNKRAFTSKFEVKIRKLVSETAWRKEDISKKDLAEVPNSVAHNQVNLQA